MTISQQLKYTHARLDAWAATRKGHAFIAADPVDFFTILTTTPGGVRALVMFHSELKRGEYEESGFVDRTFWVGLSRGRGMKLLRGADLTEQSAGGPPLFDLIEEGRQLVRNLDFDPATTEQHPNFKSINPFQVEGWLLDAYALEFSIGVQLPPPDETETTGGSQ